MNDRIGTASVRERAERAWQRHAAEALDVSTVRATLSRGSLPEAFHEAAVAHADRPCLTIADRTTTHGELDAAAGRFGARLVGLGLEPGHAVLISAPTSHQMVSAYLGALRARAVVVLASPSLSPAELTHIARDSRAKLACAGGCGRASLAGVAEHAGLSAVLDIDDEPAGDDPLPLSVDDQDPLPVQAVASDSTALVAYTSGTSGVPKGVPLSHTNLLASIRAAMLAWRWTADDVLVHALPLVHQHGLGGLHATLLAGSRAVLLEKFGSEELARTIVRETATVLFAVPTMYQRLLACERFGPGSLRLAVSGSAPLSPKAAVRLARVLGQIPLERYGTTESGLDVSNLLEGPRRPGSVGLPLPGVELAIADDDGLPAAPGQPGEIVLRGPQVFAAYLGDADATDAAFHPGGWFRTGDVGVLDPVDGYLSITGRSKDLIITGGLNVYPREVELALEADRSVSQAGVVGVQSEQWGEEVVAAVVPTDAGAFDGDAVLDSLAGRLAGYKRPKRIVVVDSLPITGMGKLLRGELARLVAAILEGAAESSSADRYRRMLRAASRRVADTTLTRPTPPAGHDEEW